MERLLLSVIALFAILKAGSAQSLRDSVYLLRMPDSQNVYVRIPNTGAYFIRNAGLKTDHSGWQLPDEFVESDCNMLYFEMNSSDVPSGPWDEYTGGSFELVIDLPIGIEVLNLDTLKRLRYHLINNYAERGSPKDANNQITGLLNFAYPNDGTVIINGTISFKTKTPCKTDQQVVYGNSQFTIFTREQFVYSENKRKELKEQHERAAEAIDNAVASEKRKFFDSIFTNNMAKANNLTGVFNGKQKFRYSLSQSYILTNAALQRRAEGDLMDMLGSSFLAVDAGYNDVYLMHCFYDPEKNTIDDEINFSLGIEFDSIMPGKTYFFHKDTGLTKAVLGYWHWGPFGGAVLSKTAEGMVSISASSTELVSGKMDITFYFNKMKVRVYGNYQLPKVSFEDVKEFRRQLEQKYSKR